MKCLIQCLVIIRLPLKALVLQCKNSVTQQQVHVPFIPFEKYSIFLLFFLVGLKMDPCFFSIAARYVWLFILMCDYCTCLSWLCQKLKTFPYVNRRWRSHLQLYEGVDVKVLKCSNQSLLVVVHTVKTCSSPSWPRILRFPVVFTFLCVVFQVKNYRKDGYTWKKRRSGNTIREDHTRLKVDGIEVKYGP